MIRYQFSGRLIAAVLCFGALACAAIAQQQNKADAKDANKQRPVVTLLEQGDAPRYELRYAPNEGDVQFVRFTQEMSMKQTMGDMDMPAQVLPVTTYTMKLTVTDVDADTGDFSCAFECVDVAIQETPDASPMVVNQLRQTLDSLRKLTGSYISSSRGFVLETKIELPDDLNPMVRRNMQSFEQSMSQLGTPLPAEAIGAGARWKVASTADLGGITSTQTYTLTAGTVTASTLATTIEIDQHADPQDFTPPGMPSGMTMKLESMDGNGSGNAVYEMSSVVPTSSTVQYKQLASFLVPMQGEQHTLTQTMTMAMTVERVPEPSSSRTAGATGEN